MLFLESLLPQIGHLTVSQGVQSAGEENFQKKGKQQTNKQTGAKQLQSNLINLALQTSEYAGPASSVLYLFLQRTLEFSLRV